MEFLIVRMVLGSGGQIEISEGEFQEIRRARDVVSAALSAEQKFDLVVENFFEFERELLELSLRQSFTHFRPWAESAHVRQRVNRRLGNLTFATKLFMDQMRHDAAELFGRNSTQREELEATLDEQRNNLAHRSLLALRDQIQHHSFPDFGMGYQGGWEDQDDPEIQRLHQWFDLRLPVGALKEGRRPGDREAEHLCEALGGEDKEVDLLHFIRQHVGCVGRIFEMFRKLLDPRLTESEDHVRRTIDRAKGEFGEKLVGLAAIRREGGYVREEVQLFEDPMKYRRALRAKNQGFESISRRFVSGMSRTLAPKKPNWVSRRKR